ncbi:uncharacterized protein LOC131693396 [Topomyia yanbarensis]|uniref:uncharacterized protein LOC131693396 n=1 Tax=Topomyia yanbarensis TaxID=2498891 RepID=UPI00273CEC44|nr:uncharacterized protein LOC131693396 [Topomyia yanbarensis]XP_058837155.1 uncharacterized protein LOC131693396 [Topomyia yanbarensis]XP_058837156.1 uncharacterized protein LOC131693396 [Topomyia yanbarensis]XP_058837157.1 uncharacterized protein LOC131693396 [Topomyia yanbarensis]
MLKWVITRGPSEAGPRVPPTIPHQNCLCDKENHCEEYIEIENNNSYAFNEMGNYFSPRKCRVSSGPLKRSASKACTCLKDIYQTESTDISSRKKPLSSSKSSIERTRKLRTRRERNKTLVKRLSSANLRNDSYTLTTTSPTVEPLSAELLQAYLNSNSLFNEREIKSPDEPSPVQSGRLFRQRVVRRKHSKTTKSIGQLQLDPNESANIFDCFVFRELAQDMNE